MAEMTCLRTGLENAELDHYAGRSAFVIPGPPRHFQPAFPFGRRHRRDRCDSRRQREVLRQQLASFGNDLRNLEADEYGLFRTRF